MVPSHNATLQVLNHYERRDQPSTPRQAVKLTSPAASSRRKENNKEKGILTITDALLFHFVICNESSSGSSL